MSTADYDRLAASCDRLLRAPGTNRARLAIGMLHLIHEHPSWLAQYRRVLDNADCPFRERPAVRGARDTWRVVRGIRGSLRPGAAVPTGSRGTVPDVLIVSRLIDDVQLTSPDDFYFGAMPELLRARGANTRVALVDHRNGAQPSTSIDGGADRLLLPRNLPMRAELTLWKECMAARKSLAREMRAARDPFEQKLARLAAEQSLSAGTAANLRLYERIVELCSAIRPRIVLTTFEGDASERMIFLGARHSGAAPLCVGYQHTRLLPRSHAVRRPLESSALPCDPDVILTLGPETQAMLEAATPRGVRYITYGSHRRIAGNSPPSREVRPASCLVLPDAEPREHALLFQFAVNCARALPDITFTFRPHPAAGAMLRRRQQIDAADLPANLRVDAQTPLLQQAGAVRCCLYRASSAVFHAVLAGARPLYVSASQEMPFDPLAAMTRGRTPVRTPADIAAAVRESDWSGSEDARIAWNYCDRYVAPVRPSALDELLLLASANG